MTTYKLVIDGTTYQTGLTAAEADELVKVARRFPNANPAIDSGPKISVLKEA